jgi:hypothetical protein
MNKYRSIDACWEFPETIYLGDPNSADAIEGIKKTGLPYADYIFDINGQKCRAICYHGYGIIPSYFSDINFTGNVKATLDCPEFNSYFEMKYLDGKLHCVDGPASRIKYSFSEETTYWWYKRGKPWYHVLSGGYLKNELKTAEDLW